MPKLYAAPSVPGDRTNSKLPERRRAVRYAFGGVAEVTHIESGKYLLSIVTELSRIACFIKTDHPFPAESKADLKITHKHTLLTASGKVLSSRPSRGMAIAFESISSANLEVLERWLSEAAGKTPRQNQ